MWVWVKLEEIVPENWKHAKKLEALLSVEGSCWCGKEGHTHVERKEGKKTGTTETQCSLCPFQFKSYRF